MKEKTADELFKELEHILSDYKRVLKENKELKILEDDIQDKRIVYIDTTEFEENYIPKQKIKDKIEELTNTKGDFATYIAISERIQVLQELLQEEDK